MDSNLYNLFGLFLCMGGAITLAYGLVISSRRAVKVSVPRMAAESDERNLLLPQVRDRVRESRFALLGIIIMTVGFLLQIIGHWPGPEGQPAEPLMTLVRHAQCI